MSVLSDKTIKKLCDLEKNKHPMIMPFFNRSVRVNERGEKIASFGVSSGGYDIRAAAEFKVFKPLSKPSLWERIKNFVLGREHSYPVLDFKNINPNDFETVYSDKVIVPPGGFLLARSVEYVHMPRNVIALCIGKSTIARAGWNCLCTPIEPDWDGYITLEFQNTTNRPNVFYAHEGVLQLVFLGLDEDCEVSYRDRGGKYLGQADRIVLPQV